MRVGFPIDEPDYDVDDRVTGPAAHRARDSFLDGRLELRRDAVADGGVDELEAFSTGKRPHLQRHLGKLARAAALLLESVRRGRGPADGLAVGDFGCSRPRLDAEVGAQTVDG